VQGSNNVETGLAQHIVPELPALQLEVDEHHHHKDVYEHSLTVLAQAIDLETGEADLTLRLAALLHDIGSAIGYDGHADHSRYIILNGNLRGLTAEQLAVVANVARLKSLEEMMAERGFVAFAPDALYPVGGYPGTDDEGRAPLAGPRINS
jgi:putative nucleotidyltransferase with HDIG domain